MGGKTLAHSENTKLLTVQENSDTVEMKSLTVPKVISTMLIHFKKMATELPIQANGVKL